MKLGFTTKKESMQWKHPGSPPREKFSTQPSASKVMGTKFWSPQNFGTPKFWDYIDRLQACLARAQWLSGRVLDSRPKGHGFEPHRRHCVVSLSNKNNPSFVLVQPRKTRPFINEKLLMGCKESNQQTKTCLLVFQLGQKKILNCFSGHFF